VESLAPRRCTSTKFKAVSHLHTDSYQISRNNAEGRYKFENRAYTVALPFTVRLDMRQRLPGQNGKGGIINGQYQPVRVRFQRPETRFFLVLVGR